MGKVALRVVENAFSVRELEIGAPSSEKGGHSLHYALPYPNSINADVVASFIARFTEKEEVVFDPFCGSGTTVLQSNLMGRVSYFSDVDPLGIKIARAKIEPADITEVTLRVQQVNMRRPINAKLFDQVFSPFYDLDTFREIYNLRSFLQQNYDRVSRFVELIALSLLHGHSAGYFSVYTFPQLSLTPASQEEMNLKRGQTPDYRAVIPRILRKVSSVLRDGLPSVMRNVSFKNRFATSDPRSVGFVPTASVDLIVTAPPRPVRKEHLRAPEGGNKGMEDFWLRSWFAGLNEQAFKADASLRDSIGSIESWNEFMNESLLEMARVCKPGARAVLELGVENNGREEIFLDRELVSVVNANLSRFWEPESCLVHGEKGTALEQVHGSKLRDLSKTQRYLVLRRR